MARAIRVLFSAIIVVLGGAPALAADSTQAPPPKAKNEGGIAGDPRGAIRALGGSGQTDFSKNSKPVDVPKLGGEAPTAVGGALAGTSSER